MKKNFCSWEQVILYSLKQGTLNPEQKKHFNECTVCSDLVTVKSWMNDFNKTSMRDIGLQRRVPDFESIWKRSRSYKTFDKELEKKVLLPLLFPKILTALFVVLGLVLLLTTRTAKLKSFVVEELKMGYLFDLLTLVGKSMLSLMPFLAIPIGMVVSLLAFYFVFSLFKPKKVREQ
jgi:hypothetical protein